MTLEECYQDKSYYFPGIKVQMEKIIRGYQEQGLNGFGEEVIARFCQNPCFGEMPLNDSGDYNSVIFAFRSFLEGAWLQQQFLEQQT